MCGPSGAVAFPHQRCETAAELKKLCRRLPTDPLVLKSYTERALVGLLLRWQVMQKEGTMKESFVKRMVTPEVKFADLSDLNHAAIRSYAMELLECAASEEDDAFVKAFCAPRDESTDNLFPAFNLTEMLFSNAYAFPGLTLVAGRTPLEQMLEMSVKLREQFPRPSDLDADLRK